MSFNWMQLPNDDPQEYQQKAYRFLGYFLEGQDEALRDIFAQFFVRNWAIAAGKRPKSYLDWCNLIELTR